MDKTLHTGAFVSQLHDTDQCGHLLLFVIKSNRCCSFTRIFSLKRWNNLFEIVPQEVLWSIRGSHQALWSLSLRDVTLHSGTWPYTMALSIYQTLHQFANLLRNWTLLPILTLLPNFGGFHRKLQRVRPANKGCFLLRTPGPVPFVTCICPNVETILSWTCQVYGPFEYRTSFGTSILLEPICIFVCQSVHSVVVHYDFGNEKYEFRSASYTLFESTRVSS